MAQETSNQARMLAQIRNALGRAAPVVPDPLPPFDSHIPTAGNASLVETFTRELEKVGGQVSCARTTAELRQRLQDLCAPQEYASVAVSAGDVLRQLGLRDWLVGNGRQVIPTLEETMTTGARSKLNSVDEYKQLLMEADLGITCADYALADTGTLVLVSGGEQHRLISLLPPVHICVLDPRNIFASLTDFLAHRQQADNEQGSPTPGAITFITGPSRTADIEHAITMGIHGPGALEVVLCSANEN